MGLLFVSRIEKERLSPGFPRYPSRSRLPDMTLLADRQSGLERLVVLQRLADRLSCVVRLSLSDPESLGAAVIYSKTEVLIDS